MGNGSAVVAEPAGRIMSSVDIFLSGGAYLHLEQGRAPDLGWWLLGGGEPVRLSVADAFRAAPAAVRREVILEAQRLVVAAMRHRDRPDLESPAWRVAISRLEESIRAARDSLSHDERVHSLGHLLADRLVE